MSRVWLFHPCAVQCKPSLYPFGYGVFLHIWTHGLDFHIGVGSNVVCSTEIGNARALVRGMDNRRFHAFFVSMKHGYELDSYLDYENWHNQTKR